MAKTKGELCCCYDCEKAHLMQWFKNPIIARCKLSGSRDVAKSQRYCQQYTKRKKKRV